MNNTDISVLGGSDVSPNTYWVLECLLPDSAQGWRMNDSGKWIYYGNGKAVTGSKKIGGETYAFNQYGEIKPFVLEECLARSLSLIHRFTE